MPPEDYKSPLQSVSGVAAVSPTSGPATVGGYTNPLIEQRRQLGPKLAEAAQSYPGALQAAREAQMKAYDNASGIRNEEIGRLSKPGQNQMWGRFGASLLAPTSTGSFFEGFGRAANAAMDERDRYNDKEAERLEKLTRSRLALEELHANKPNAQIGAIEDSMKAYEFADKSAGIVADIDLGNGPTPTGDDALLADYSANPNKYAGARGRAMIQAASERVKAAQQRQFELDKIDRRNAGQKGQIQPMDRAEANRVSKRKGELMAAADAARGLDSTISQLESARNRTDNEGIRGSTFYSNTFGWLTDEAAAGQEVNAQATRLKLQLSETLKGAISNAEQEMLDRAVPGMGMSDAAAKNSIAGYRAATQRAKERSLFYESWVQANGNDYGADEAWDNYVAENPLLSENDKGELQVNNNAIGNWKQYVVRQNEDGSVNQTRDSTATLGFDTRKVPQDVLQEAQSQIDDGADPQQVLDYLREKYGEEVEQ